MKRHLFVVALLCSLGAFKGTVSAQMQYVSNNLIRVATTTIEAGSKDNPILRFSITVNPGNPPLVLNEIRVAIPAASQWIRNVRILYTGDSDQFSTGGGGLGSSFVDNNTNEWVFQPDFPLFPVTTQYFWLTYDMSLCAPSGTVIGGALNSFKLNGVTRTPANPNPSGQATIMLPQPLRFTAVNNGFWHFGTTWETGEVPCDNTPIPIYINSNVDVITTVQAENRIVVNANKTLKVAQTGNLILGNGNSDVRLFLDGKIRVESGQFNLRGNISSANSSALEIAGGVFRSGDTGGDNKILDLASDVTITGGKLEANGTLNFSAFSELVMSNGEIVVDPNGGTAAKSAASGLAIQCVPSITGGTITIVDPPFSGTDYSYSFSNTGGTATGATLIIGGSSGTHSSTASVGFKVLGGPLTFGRVIFNGGRKSNFRQANLNGFMYAQRATINSGTEVEMTGSGTLVIGDSLVNNGICSACRLSFGNVAAPFHPPSEASAAQTLSGAGFFKKSTADPDPTNPADNKIVSLDVSHTLNSPGVTIHMPLTITESFWPRRGKTTLSGNHLLTIGESASNPGLLIDGADPSGPLSTGWVTTPLRRWTQDAGVPTGYNDKTLFPVGDATRRRNIYLAHPAGVTTTGTLTVQFKTEDPGTSGFPLTWGGKFMVSSSPTGYWQVTNAGVSGVYNVIADGNGFQNRSGSGIGITEEMSVMRRTNNVWAANEGEPKTPTGLDRLRSEGFSTYGDFGIGGTALLFGTPKTYSSVAVAQPQTSAVDAGSTFISVVRVDVEVYGTQNSLPVTQIVFNTNGTTNTFDLRNARVFFTGTSDVFTNTTPFGNEVANPDGTFTVTGNQELTGGAGLTKNYFWLAYDLRYCAPTGNVVDGELVSITVGGNTYTPANGNPGAGRSVNAFGMFTYVTVADGNWNDFNTWDDGCIPRNVTNNVSIAHNVTVTGNANTDGTVTLQANKKLTIASGGTLTVGLPGGDNNLFLPLSGSTVEITGGTFNLNGSISFAGSTFAMSAGNLNVDPNNGTGGVSGTTVLNFPSTAILNVTGGNITIVDPPFGTGIFCLGFLSGTSLFNLNATLTLGGTNGVNTSANPDGFRINTGSTTRGLVFANVVVNGGRKSDNRHVLVGGYLYCGNLTVNSGCEMEMPDGSANEIAVSGNLVNDGVICIPSNRRLVFHGGVTVGPLTYQNAATGHTLSGTGRFKLLAADPDPAQQNDQQLGQLAVFNTAGSPGLNCQMPLIVTNILRLSAGRINLTAPNRLQLGAAAGAGTLADLTATGWINGPFQRWTRAAATAYTLTDNFSYFPVGDSTARRLIRVAFPTGGPTASGIISAQFNNTAPGGGGLPITWGGVQVGAASPTGYWQLGSTGAAGSYTARVDATGFTGCGGTTLSNAGTLRLIKRPNGGAWSASEGSAGAPATLDAVEGSGFSTFSEFGIGLPPSLTASCKNIPVALNGTSVSVAASDLNDNSLGCGALSYSIGGQSTVSFNCSHVGTPQSLTLTVTDSQGGTATCQSTVTVSDNTAPLISCPANTTVSAGANCAATLGAYALLSKSDHCAATGNITEIQSPAAGSPISGHNVAHSVTFTANDGNGNTSTCSFTVTTVDQSAPSISCPANTTVSAGANCAATLGAYALLSKSDNCAATGSITEIQSPAAGSPISGHNVAHTVTFTANDGNGNTSTCSFTVTTADQSAPGISCPANTTVSAGANCTVTLGAYALLSKSDNCAATGSITEIQSPAAGSPISGHNVAHIVTFTANDGNGNTSTCSFTVTTADQSAPGISCPANTTVSAGANCAATLGAYALLSKSDNCAATGDITEIQSPAAGSPISGHNVAHTVTFTANDGNGNTSTCSFTVTTVDMTAPGISCPASLTVPPTETAPCSAIVSGIDAGFGDNCNTAVLTYTRSGASNGSGNGQASGLSFASGQTTVTYTVTDGAALSASCTFTVTVGSCANSTVFSGTIFWEHNGTSGVQNATVNLTGPATGNDLSDQNGEYLISIPPTTGNFILKPTKNANKLNGVSSADVTAIQQHVTNVAPLPAPFKRIAADVNKSNSISTLDATIINQALQGNPSALNLMTSWRFVPSSYTFPNPNAPWGFPEQINLTNPTGNVAGQDFKGIKLGDVAATWANPANFGKGEPLVLRLHDQTLQAGAEVSAEFRADQLDDLNSFQFALHFDPEWLQLVEIEPLSGLPLSMDHFGTYNVAEGEIRLVWAQPAALMLSEAAPLFRLRFRALESGARLSEVLRLNGEALPGYCYNSQYAESGVELRYATATGTGQTDSAMTLTLENQPNPFAETTTLRFVLPVAGVAELRISDAAGRLLFSQKKQYAAGSHQEVLQLENTHGVLFAELVTEQGSVVRKMLAVKN